MRKFFSTTAISTLAAAAAIGATGLSFNAAAQQTTTPWYIGADAGKSRYDLGSLSGDRKDTAYNFNLGYNFSPNVAIEGGYADFGDWHASDVDGQAKTTYGAFVLTAPIGERFAVFGKAGYGSTKRSYSSPDVTIINNGTVITALGYGASEKKSEALYGVGASYAFNPNVKGTLNWTRLDDTKADMLTVGARFTF